MTATPDPRQTRDETGVVEVYGSKFLLEWLDPAVLASAAARTLTDREQGPRRAA